MSPPFNETRYNRLMSGLKTVEVNVCTLACRLDSEYYTFKPLKIENVDFLLLGNVCEKITQGSNPHFSDKGYICLNGKNVYWGTMTAGEMNYVPKSEFDRLSSFLLQRKDIVITLKHANKIGRSWIVEDNIPRIFGRNIGLIRLNHSSNIYPEYILMYLWTKYGQAYLDHNTTGGTNGQITLPTSALKKMPIPKLSTFFQRKIKELYDHALTMQQQATLAYSSAESSLLTSLNMKNFTPSLEPIAIKSFSKSFGSTGRLDAEYYQKKYEDIEISLKTKSTVGNLCHIYDAFMPPSSDTKCKYIELADIGTTGNIIRAIKKPFAMLPSRARRWVKSGQVIISSIEGSLSSCALVTDEYDGAICSTGFYVIDSTKINSETLLALFKSTPIQALMKKRCSGSILTAISKSELENMPLPLIDSITQSQIAKMIQNSFELRHESERLLDASKRAVEIAIEEGEEKAIKFLNAFT